MAYDRYRIWELADLETVAPRPETGAGWSCLRTAARLA